MDVERAISGATQFCRRVVLIVAVWVLCLQATACGEALYHGPDRWRFVECRIAAHGGGWTRLVGSDKDDRIRGVDVGATGRVHVAGITSGRLCTGRTEIEPGKKRAFAAVFRSNGAPTWTRLVRPGESGKAFDVAAGPEGGLHVVGVSGLGRFDAFVAKYDSTGERQWIRTVRGPEEDKLFGVAVDASGRVYAVGYVSAKFEGRELRGSSEVLVASWNGRGKRRWARTFGTKNDTEFMHSDAASSVDVTAGGVVSVAGVLYQEPPNKHRWKVFAAQYRADGQRSWIRFGRSGTSWFNTIQQLATDRFGAVYMAPSFDRDDAGYSPGARLRKYGSGGGSLWDVERKFGAPLAGVTGLTVPETGPVYATGFVCFESDPGGSSDFEKVCKDHERFVRTIDPSAAGTSRKIGGRRFEGTSISRGGIAVGPDGAVYTAGNTTRALAELARYGKSTDGYLTRWR